MAAAALNGHWCWLLPQELRLLRPRCSSCMRGLTGGPLLPSSVQAQPSTRPPFGVRIAWCLAVDRLRQDASWGKGTTLEAACVQPPRRSASRSSHHQYQSGDGPAIQWPAFMPTLLLCALAAENVVLALLLLCLRVLVCVCLHKRACSLLDAASDHWSQTKIPRISKENSRGVFVGSLAKRWELLYTNSSGDGAHMLGIFGAQQVAQPPLLH